MNKRSSVFKDVYTRPYYHNFVNLPQSSKDDENFVQRLSLLESLPVHNGCVNTICWNDKGNLILSGSDDQYLVVTNGYNYKIETKHPTSHLANIFSAKFLPSTNDIQVISCSGDGVILHTDLSRPQETYYNQFHCHSSTTTYEVVTIPNDPSTFLSCGEDGTVRCFDLRTKTSCNKKKCKDDILVSCPRGVTALAVNPKSPNQLAAGCADSTVRIYDRRHLSTNIGDHLKARPFCTFVAPGFKDDRHFRITSLNFDSVGREMLVSYSSDYLYLFNILNSKSTELKKRVKHSLVKEKTILKGNKHSPPPVRRLRLRGDWSDTGPDARPERDNITTISIGQARPQLQATLMQRMTDVLSRMLNDPMTRTALSAGGEDSVDPEETNNREIETNSNSASGSMDVDESLEPANNVTSISEPSTPNTGTNVTSHLHDHLATLRNLRDGLINQHGAEPSVSFRYSQQSTSNSTISLKVGDKNEKSVNEGASTSNCDTSASGNVNEDDMDIDLEESDDSECSYDKNDLKTMIYEADMKQKYMGHRNTRTMIKEATFWGDNYVMSGSDCGHVFVWDRTTADLKMLLQADQHVVNCLQPHPTLPILATSGIDYDVKLWAPISEENGFDRESALDLIKRNAIMMEETRDTITVPAAFMIRMLACLNQIRRGARNRNRRANEES